LKTFILACLSFSLSAFFYSPQKLGKKKSDSFILNPFLFNFIHFGERELTGSLIWADTFLKADLTRYKTTRNWITSRFQSVSVLSPWLFKNYLYGGQYLSVITDELIGAESVYSKGLHYYPSDGFLNFFGGAHALVELELRDISSRRFQEARKDAHLAKLFPSLRNAKSSLFKRSEDYEKIKTKLKQSLRN